MLSPQNIHGHKQWFEVVETTARSQVAVMELTPTQASGAEMEIHADSDQALFVVEGQVEGEIADKDVILCSGDFILIPAGTPHRFTNTSSKPALTFNVYSPPAYPSED